jgi:hypothetical protein
LTAAYTSVLLLNIIPFASLAVLEDIIIMLLDG